MKKVELLAPAGSYKKAKIAFLYGADAVYTGTKITSLRTRTNMDIKEVIKIVDYAHEINKKVYLTMNIYARDEDYIKIEEELNELKNVDIDGIICSDPGVISKVKEILPNVDIHISTQANIVSAQAANFWYKYGAKRVILARELTKEQIYNIKKNINKDMQVEIFIHGAICYAYSGRCYLSKYMNDRCANLGDCSQPCRWQYNLVATEVGTKEKINIDYDEKGTYLFSSKDMCLLKQIPSIIDNGIDSLKIEGRLKTDYYLATVVRTYRAIIDYYYENKENIKNGREIDFSTYINELNKVKTRGLSQFYFSSSDNYDTIDFDSKSFNLEYEYGGLVIQKENEFSDENIYSIFIKNKLSIGDKLEILYPGTIKTSSFNITKLYDYDTNLPIDTVNPGTTDKKVKIHIPFSVDTDYILRKKK